MALKICIVFTLCLTATVFSVGNGERVRYDNYRVYKVIASSVEQLAVLKQLEGATDSINFLDGVHGLKKHARVVVAPHKVPDFLQLMNSNEIEYQLLERDLQRLIGEPKEPKEVLPQNYNWNDYNALDDTYSWLRSLASSYPGVVTTIEAGKTYEKRSILGVKISAKNNKQNKPGIFLEAGIHAREWIAPATATYIINQLLTSKDASVQELFENYDWYIFPHTNPDGYVHTHTTDRMWRKTRKPYDGCFGTDANRNWDFHWNEVGASSSPCSETFAGPKAFSELETLSLSNYIASLKGKIQLYISFHSYSQLLLYPYGHTGELPDNHEDYEQVFDATVSAIKNRHGSVYTGGNIYDAIYPAAGASVDWVYGTVGVRMGFSFELRPDSNSAIGFFLPPEEIIPTGEETLDAFVAMVNEVNKLGYFNS